MSVCHVCGVPADAGFFDESSITKPPVDRGSEVILARYPIHRNYCGMLMYFSQFTDRYAADPTSVETPGYRWEIRRDGQLLAPYRDFAEIINPWGLAGFPLSVRLDQGSVLEFAIRNIGPAPGDQLQLVGGRIIGRYWYDTRFGGAPNPL